MSILAAGVVVSVATAMPVFAIANSHANVHAQSNPSTSASSQAGAHLAAAKLRSCQNRQTAINNILARIANRGQKQLDLFSTIATRVENFYVAKGNSLSNYDALVANVDTQKTVAQAEVDTIKSASVTFKCDGTDPKGAAQLFLTDLKSEISALQAYRTSVKNLIVGVASVQGTSTSTTDSTSGGQ